MVESKNNSGRSGKQQAFKQKQQAEARKAASAPRQKIIPNITWESNDILQVRGDLLEAFNKTIEMMYHGFNQLGQIYQQIVAMNVHGEANPEGKIKVKYLWNNGEEVSEKDLKIFQQKMAELQALQAKQQQELQQKAAVLERTKESSGLVTAEGTPLTEESVEQASKIIV